MPSEAMNKYDASPISLRGPEEVGCFTLLSLAARQGLRCSICYFRSDGISILLKVFSDYHAMLRHENSTRLQRPLFR